MGTYRDSGVVLRTQKLGEADRIVTMLTRGRGVVRAVDDAGLRDESLEDSAGLPEPHLLAQEIADDLRSALAQIEDVLGDLEQRVAGGEGG